MSKAKIVVKSPMTESDVRKFKAGDIIYISGAVVTARDSAHKKAVDLAKNGKKDQMPMNLEGITVFHCGPVVKKVNNEWRFVSAGPTTSTRLEVTKLGAELIEHYKTRAFIGKGGMGKVTAEACKKYGAMYLLATGGAGATIASFVKKVKNVYWLDELGMPEALWELDVVEFGPLTVCIDANGNDLYEERYKIVQANKDKAMKILG